MARNPSITAHHVEPQFSGSEADSATEVPYEAPFDGEEEPPPPKSRRIPAPLHGARRTAPTREEEVELAKRIEQANHRLVEAILGSLPALDELVALATDARDGVVDADQLVTAALHEEDEEQPAVRILEVAQRAQEDARGRARRAVSVPEGDTSASEVLASTILRYGLSPRAVTRILARLTELGARQRGSGAQLDRTIRCIRESWHDAERAKTVLVEANMGLVFWMAQKRGNSLLPLPDLVQEGTLGLMRAVEKFDWRRGVRFNTYAVWWIRHAINRALSDQPRIIRIPVHQLETRHRVARVAQEFSNQNGREPSLAELSELTGLSIEKVQAASTLPPEPVSIDAPLREDGDATLEHLVADPTDISVLDEISSRQVRALLMSLLSTLNAREQEVLRLRFGMDGAETLTLQQIGRRFALSRERVRQIEMEALAKLRIPAAAGQLDAHLLQG